MKTRSEYIKYTPELNQELKKLIQNLPRADGLRALRKRLNLSERQGRTIYARIINGIDSKSTKTPHALQEETIPKSKGARMTFRGDVGEIDLVDDSARTLDDLLKICKVDLDVWEVEKYVINKWEMGRKDKIVNLEWRDGVANGHVEDTGKITKAPLWQVKAWLRRKVQASALNQMLEKFVKEASKHAPKKFVFEKPKAQKDCCYVLNGQDLHLAKMAWNPETGGGDWDIKIARQADDAAVAELMAKAPLDRIEEIVMIIGSDMLQIDNDQSTTSKGTYVDSDSRFAKAFGVASEMITTRIEKLASRFKVKAVVIPGNHDSSSSFFLGRYVEAWFRNHPNVTIDSTPISRKYHPYGTTLIGFDHGEETKLSELPLIIMRENQSIISNFKHIECLTGHLHAEASEDTKGIIVRTAPALCAPDRWHSRKGYIGSVRRSQGLLYNKSDGLEAIFYSKSLNA